MKKLTDKVIYIHEETDKELKKIGRFQESYNELILRLLEERKERKLKERP